VCPLCLTSALVALGGAAGIGGTGVALIKRARGAARHRAALVDAEGPSSMARAAPAPGGDKCLDAVLFPSPREQR
jgi:hypothetical protein